MDIKQYALQFARWHSIWERKAAPIFYRALAQSIAPVLITLNEKDLLTTPWLTAYKKAYGMIGTVAAKMEYRQLRYNNPTKADADIVSFFSEKWKLSMEQYGSEIALNFSDELTETTLNKIREVLSFGFQNSYTNSQLADALRGYLLNDGKRRALRIARTEATTAASIGKNEGAKDYFKEIGETKGYKMWISRADAAVRTSHVIENETIVPFDEDFNLLHSKGKYPGDPKLSSDDRVNCRCTFVVLSERGYQRRLRMGTGKNDNS